MDNIVNKQAIIDEYLLGGISYRRLSKKYGVARATLHEWVRDFTGIAIITRGTPVGLSVPLGSLKSKMIVGLCPATMG
jgi:transposase